MGQRTASNNLSPEPRITIFGVGGAGGNAVSSILARPDRALRVICANTDMQALRRVPEAHRLQLGRQLTGGLGAGAQPEIGRLAAEEALPEIERALAGTSLCFIAAGMGGGTGTGAAPVIARAARAMGILTIAVATKPFAFEGARRNRVAEAGGRLLEDAVDALVVVCNEHLFRVAGADATLRAALTQSDDVVCESARHFAALVAGPALKRISVADVRMILSAGGRTVVGYGESHSGAERAVNAARSALRNPLLDGVVSGARRLIVSVAGGEDLGLFEVEQAISHVRARVCADAEIVWGSVVDRTLDGQLRIGIAAAELPKGGVAEPRTVAPTACAKQVAQPACDGMAAIAVGATVPEGAAWRGTEHDLTGAKTEEMVLELGTEYRLAHLSKRQGVRSRHKSANLVDRLYFATRHLRRTIAGHVGLVEAPSGKRADRVFRTTLPPPRTNRVPCAMDGLA